MTGRDAFDTLAPEFTVEVNGAALPNAAAADLQQMSVEDDLFQPSACSLVIGAWDTVQMKPKWIDDALFRIGNPVTIALGYRDHTLPVYRGVITTLRPAYSSGKPIKLTVHCLDILHRAMRSKRSFTYSNCTDSDIVAQAASRVGLPVLAQDTAVKLPVVVQHNQTDLEFMRQRAERIGYELLMRLGELWFRPPATDGSPVMTLHPEVELLEFHPRQSTLGLVTSVEVRGWDAQTKQSVIGRSHPSDAGSLMGGRMSGADMLHKAFDEMPGARTNTPVQSIEEADAMAHGAFAEMTAHTIEATGTCIGDPRLHAGVVVAVEGLGETFSGHYYLTGVRHAYSPKQGYRTHFNAARNAT